MLTFVLHLAQKPVGEQLAHMIWPQFNRVGGFALVMGSEQYEQIL